MFNISTHSYAVACAHTHTHTHVCMYKGVVDVCTCIYMSYDEKCLRNVFVSISNLVVLNSITYINVYFYDLNYSSSDILLNCLCILTVLYICVSMHVSSSCI